MEWTNNLSVGVSTIDSQHQELFKRINNLVIAIKQHRCKGSGQLASRCYCSSNVRKCTEAFRDRKPSRTGSS